MEEILAFLLVMVVAAFVAWPLLAVNPADSTLPESELSPLERQKIEAYAAIKEAEFDYQTGKLGEADFAAIREKYTQQAISALAAIESARAATSARGVAKDSAGLTPQGVSYCPACGQGLPPEANFCPGCGYALKALRQAVT